MAAKEVSEQEAAELVKQFNEGKQNMHSFFTNVVKSDDTTKTGNLTIDELGNPKLPVRTYKELAAFCDDVVDEKTWGEYFDRMAEIQTSTSLSKDGFLMRLAVTIKKELADVTKQKKSNKGWFKKKGGDQLEQS